MVRLFALAIGSALLAGMSWAQQALPGCEAVREVHRTFREQVHINGYGLKFADRIKHEYQVLEGLIAKYPREFEPYQQLIWFVRGDDPDQLPKLAARLGKQAGEHPDDPFALLVAGMVLEHSDTPAAIQLLEEARAKAPHFAWPNYELAQLYSSGKRVDKKKASEYLAAFFSICPDSGERGALNLLAKGGDVALEKRVATALRARLARETDPDRLKAYELLWGLEFRTHQPQEHDAVRQQVAKDVKRLEKIDAGDDFFWQEFLRRAYKQSGASEEVRNALDDRILKEFPHSQFAPGIPIERWNKTHKKPDDPKDAKAWAAWQRAYEEAVKGWVREYPDIPYFSRNAWFSAIRDDDTISEKEGVAALDHNLKVEQEFDGPASGYLVQAAGFLVDHNWELSRAIALLQKAEPLLAKEQEQDARDDNMSADEQQLVEEGAVYDRQQLAGYLLRAARAAGRPEAVQSIWDSIEGPPPQAKRRQSDYWLNRARLAALENRKVDGLAYYQLALQTRVEPPGPVQGKLADHLTDEARALWKDTGGTEAAWSVWSKPQGAKPQELAEGRWEKPNKQIPTFELADLSGKTWKLKTLEGKSVLINLWATWCGPCNAELPQLEKLYETVKDRKDVQILTFNVDEDLGLVGPFMKEKGYQFPVLPAFSLVHDLLDAVGIPQNWVIDPHGAWRWTQLGYGGEPDWVGDMIKRLESVKKGEDAPKAE